MPVGMKVRGIFFLLPKAISCLADTLNIELSCEMNVNKALFSLYFQWCWCTCNSYISIRAKRWEKHRERYEDGENTMQSLLLCHHMIHLYIGAMNACVKRPNERSSIIIAVCLDVHSLRAKLLFYSILICVFLFSFSSSFTSSSPCSFW